MKSRANHVVPIKIKSILKVHLQPYFTEHPEMIGPRIGPKLEACRQCQYLNLERRRLQHTDIYEAIARPRLRISKNRSAYTPPMTVCGAAPIIPHIKRKTRREDQLGARAQPSVASTKTVKDHMRTGFRPIVSLSGLKRRGPIT
jgi:hypothetical protein